MATHQSRRDNADAFDDLLGQLVDELALQPTMVPEPEPTPAPRPVAVAPVAYQPPVQEAPPPAPSNVMPIAVGGGIAVAGVAIALVMLIGGGDSRPSVPQEAARAAAALPRPAPPPAPVVAPVAAPVVAAPLPPTLPPGTGLPGQPVDPAALAQAPGSEPTATPPASGSKPKPRPRPKPSTSGKPKPAPGKPAVVDPFG